MRTHLSHPHPTPAAHIADPNARLVTRLRFELDSGCRDLIDKALTEVRALSTDFDLQVFEFNTFGKGFMKR